MAVATYLLISLLAALVLVPFWSELMRSAGHVSENYRGKLIPQSMGSVLLPVFSLALAFALRTRVLDRDVAVRAAITVIGLGLLGLLDDIWGDGRARGFGGHFRRLARGEITTGAIKAFGGFLVALWAVSALPGFLLLLFWRAATVALSANLLNLLDLRPGRALKGFFAISLAFAWLVPSEASLLLLFPGWLTALVYLPWDLSGKSMLGDSGANALGGLLGLAVVLAAPAGFQVVYLALLVLLHLLAERFSFTRLITSNPVLYFLDMLGRKGWEK